MAWDPLSPDVTYAAKGTTLGGNFSPNIYFPGTAAQATASATAAASRLADAYPFISSTTLVAGLPKVSD